MKKIRNGLKSLLLLAACLTLLLGAIPAAAELADAEKDTLAQNVEQFLTSVYALSDTELEQLRANGGFYEVFVDSWTAAHESVGEFKSIDSTEVDDSQDDQIVVTSRVSFDKYTADVIIYIDSETRTPVNYEMNIDYSLQEKVVQGAQNMAVGLIVVFGVLIFLTLVIYLFRFINPDLRAEKAKKAAAAAPAEKVPERSTPAQVSPAAAAVPAAGGSASEELVAVIAAAIAAAEADGMQSPQVVGIPAPVVYDHGDPSYQVRPLRRNSSRSWKRS